MQKMNKRIIAFFMAALLSCAVQTAFAARKCVVWEHPATEVNTEIEGYFMVLLEITRVELDKDETRVWMRVAFRPEGWVKFTSDTYLLADGKRYVLKRCEGMELDKEVHLTDHGCAEMVFHFEPLPKDIKRFDFIEGDGEGAFRLLGVESAKTRAERLFPSNWRNTQTGNWDISFYYEFAIYDCRFWTYKQQQQKGDKYDLVLENDGREINVQIEKNKKGTRIIAIDGVEGEYELISTITLPDYPTKDTQSTFKDTGYRTDTATVVGWLKDMPEGIKRRGSEYSVGYTDIFMQDQVSYYDKLDSLGRFVIKVPLANPTEVFMDWKHTFIRTVLEPGETYFLLYDFKGGHKLFMGNDARLQNETLAHPIRWVTGQPNNREMDKDAAMAFLESMKREKEDAMEQLQKVVAQHPTVSQRYINYLTGHYSTDEGRELMQGRFSMKDMICPDEYLDYVNEQYKKQQPHLYTLYRNFSTFLNDFTNEHLQRRYATKKGNYLVYMHEPYYSLLKRKRDNGEISITDEELKDLFDYHRLITRLRAIGAEDGPAAMEKEAEKPETKAMIEKVAPIMRREDVERIIEVQKTLEPIERQLAIADSLGCDKELREILITRMLYRQLDHERSPLNETIMQFFEANVSLPAAKEFLHAKQQKYQALQQKEVSAILKSPEDVAGMSDGEKILRKLIEPYKGKIILVDVWGTWCGPCKAALAKSQEEYKRLKDYDIVYLYLANNSSDESWKKVIKQYDVTGDNVVHYNLPAEQQSAIEKFLGVNSFPTYKLIDRNGQVLDVNADPRNLDALSRVLEQLK